jgi:hypothetical protein
MGNWFIIESTSQVELMAGTSGGNTKIFGNTSVTNAITIPSYSGNAILCVGTYGQGPPTGMTFNGVGLTIKATQTAGSRHVRTYYLDNPPIGTYNLTMSGDSFDDTMMGHAAFKGVGVPSTGTPTNTSGSGTTSSASSSAETTDIVFASFNGSGSNDFTISQGTMLYNDRQGSVTGGVGWNVGVGGSTTVSFTHGSLSWLGSIFTAQV